MSRVIRPNLFLIAIAFGLVGCGFKLAGTTSLPPSLNTIYLVTTDFNEHQRAALLSGLERAGSVVTTKADIDAVTLAVNFKAIADRTLVSSASTGKIVRRMARGLDYSLKTADGEQLVISKTLVQQKDIVLDDDNLHSSARERADVIEDLEQALYNQLILQLKRL